MFETHITRTYNDAFARARAERASAFRDLFTLFRRHRAMPAGTRTA
jgi:hypothetical protein